MALLSDSLVSLWGKKLQEGFQKTGVFAESSAECKRLEATALFINSELVALPSDSERLKCIAALGKGICPACGGVGCECYLQRSHNERRGESYCLQCAVAVCTAR